MSQKIMENFYQSFARLDAKAMVSLYHPDTLFNDPVFVDLNAEEVKAMWQMLIDRSKGELVIEYHSLIGDEEVAQCTWEAKYTFSKTGREVHNIIHSTMEFKDNQIITHTDHFNFWRWSGMALGTPGKLLGWTPIIKGKVQKMARKSLDDYLSH